MANTPKQIRYGSRGTDVTELQETLNTKGYSLSVDGIFGTETEKAVKDYQKKSGLSVDGIVGVNTWGALLGEGSSDASSENTGLGSRMPFRYPDYKESSAVKEALSKKDASQNAVDQYKDFTYDRQEDLDEVIDRIFNRKDFSFDLNGNAMYQQYADQYAKRGQLAMMDTIGQEAAMNGGYGSSYGQMVGQQAYNAQLENLNDLVPELYQMELDRYNQEGQDLYNRYAMLNDERATAYGEHLDGYERALAERNYYSGAYDNERSLDYGRYADDYDRAYDQYWREYTADYQRLRDEISDKQWQKQYELAGGKPENETENKNTEDSTEPTVDEFSDWSAGDWESYFAQIRASEGQDAAKKELNDFIKKGLIPQNMVAFASIGVRGSFSGH